MCFFFRKWKLEASLICIQIQTWRETWNSFFFWFTTYRAAKLEHWLDCCRPRISDWRTSPRRSEFQNQVNALSQTTEYLKQVLSNYCQRQNVNALWHACGLTEHQKESGGYDLIYYRERRLNSVSYNSIVLLHRML